MVEIRETIARLSKGFVAADIMTPTDRLICGKDADHARQLLEENKQFDILPICNGNRITSFVNQQYPSKQTIINIQHTISSETTILDLIDSLIKEPFVFVVGQRRIIGYIHFSDLNDPIVKIPLFVLLEGLERIVTDQIRYLVTDENIGSLIKDTKRLEMLNNRMENAKKEVADRDWVTMFYFKEILEGAKHFGEVSLKQKDIDILAAVRDDVFHAASKRELVGSHGDIRRLQKVRDICLSILYPESA